MPASYSATIGIVLLGAAILSGVQPQNEGPQKKQIVPLPHAHAHNDYQHKRPLQDALEQGFCSVEADVFSRDGRLLVGHVFSELQPDKTLEKLYLDPLRKAIKENAGRVYRNGPVFHLLVDVKSDAKSTYQHLDKVLASYADILSVVKDGKLEEKAVTVVVSGNRAIAEITAQKIRYVGIDGRPADLESTAPAHRMPWISERWGALFTWRGEGPMPEAERSKLREFVGKAHKHGRKVRFWATPENEALWKELRAADVDWINTDTLEKLASWMRSRGG